MAVAGRSSGDHYVTWSGLVRVVYGEVLNTSKDGERFHNLSGQPASVFDLLHSKKKFFLRLTRVSCVAICISLGATENILTLSF